MTDPNQRLRKAYIIAVLVAILGGAMIGFVCGYKVRATTHPVCTFNDKKL